MSTLQEAVVRVGELTNKAYSESKVKDRLIRHINEVRQYAWRANNWSWRRRAYQITTIAEIDSGTVSVTNGSYSVTFSSGVLVSGHKGALLRIDNDTPNQWYKIRTVSSTTGAVLETPYQGVTNGSATFKLKTLDYNLPPDMDGYPLSAEIMAGRRVPIYKSPINIFLEFHSTDEPVALCNWSRDPSVSTYSTGTITTSADSRTVTGSGTAWIANVLPGDELSFTNGTTTYRYAISSADSDTSLTLYPTSQVAVSASTYTITRQFTERVRVSPSPDDEYVITLYGARKFYGIYNDSDTDELLTFYPDVIVAGAVEKELLASPDSRSRTEIVKFEAALMRAKMEDRAKSFGINGAPLVNVWGINA